jgi:hypothetical protein
MPSSVVTWHPDAAPRGTAGRLNGTFPAFSALGTVFIFVSSINNIVDRKNSKAPQKEFQRTKVMPQHFRSTSRNTSWLNSLDPYQWDWNEPTPIEVLS